MPNDLLAGSSSGGRDLLAADLPTTGKTWLGISYNPQKEALAKQQISDWGTGYPKAVYNLGGAASDYLASKGLPAPAAAGVGTAINFVGNAIPSMISSVRGLPAPTDAEQAAQALAGQKSKVLQAGKQLGLKVSPTQVNPNVVNRTLESVGGKIPTAQQISADNEALIYAAGQKASGLQPNQAINEDTLAAAKNIAAAPYRQIAQSSPKAAQALEDWQNANLDAKLAWNEFNRMGSRQAYKDAKTAETAAEAALGKIEELAPSGLVDSLKAARVQIAKIKTVEDAMRGSSFSAQSLARALDKGVPLSGDLKTLARFAQDFPNAVRPPQNAGGIGVNQLLPYVGGVGGGIGGGLIGHLMGEPLSGSALGTMAGVAASQAIPPAARSLVLSGPYQSLMANIPGPSNAPALLQSLLMNPATSSATGALYQR